MQEVVLKIFHLIILETTTEMLEDFLFLDDKTRKLIVIDNPNKIADMAEIIEVIIETGGIPFSPKIDKSVETVTDLVFTKASDMYGDPLPYNIEERISKSYMVMESMKR